MSPMNSKELRLKRLVFATILCVGISITAIAFFLSNYQSGTANSSPTFLFDGETDYTLNASTKATIISEVDFTSVKQVLLFSTSWSALGGRMRNELNSLARDLDPLEFKFYDASEAVVDNLGINSFPTIMLVNDSGQEVVRFEPASEANLELVIQELQK